MGTSRKNTFRKATRHLKSTQIDEKLQLLSELPTNNTTSIYVIEPEREEIVGQNINAPLDLVQDDPSQNGRDTSGLFAEDGSILTIEPPGNTSYILGPMISMWYAWGNFSTIGYVRQSDRRMVNLGSITGRISNWNGTSNFTSYGQLTLAQAQWYRDQYLNGNTQQYRAFYPGPPSNPADQFGRYLGDIINVAKEISREILSKIPPFMGGFDQNTIPGSANPNNKKKKDKDNLPDGSQPLDKVPGENLPTRGSSKPKTNKGLQVDTKYHGTSKDAADKIKQGGFRPTGSGLVPNSVWVGDKKVADKYAEGGKSSGSMSRNAPENQAVIPVRIPKGSGTTFPGPFGRETAIPKNVADIGAKTGNVSKDKRGTRKPSRGTVVRTPGMSGSLGATGSPSGTGPYTPGGGGRFGIGGVGLADEYENKKHILSESTKSVLKNLKKPYVLPEEPKTRLKYKPKIRSIGENMMKTPDIPKEFKPQPNVWRKHDYAQNERLSQERKNEVLDHLGASDHAWEWLTETSKKKSNKIMYGNFGDTPKEYEVVRKEELKGDTLLFLVDENGNQESILQSELSCRIADEYDRKLFSQYIDEQETAQVDKDPLFKKVSKRLKKEIDYPDKPSKKGYPNDPPPEMINGWHPKFADRADHYNKLDPQSAHSMPETDNPEINAKVKAAKNNPK